MCGSHHRTIQQQLKIFAFMFIISKYNNNASAKRLPFDPPPFYNNNYILQ